MTTYDLDEFASAYERVERRLRVERDWSGLEDRVRRRLRGPTWRLVSTVVVIAFCLVVGLSGRNNGVLVGMGLLLAVLPGRVSDLRKRRRALAAVETAEDVRALCAKEAQGRFAGAVLRCLLLGGLGLLYLLVGLVAGLLDKSPWPGVIAGLLVLGWSAAQFFVFMPRAARELSVFVDDDDVDDDDDDDDGDDDDGRGR